MSLTQPLPPNEDRAPQLYAALWIPIPICAAILSARFYVRFNMRNVRIDDWMMLFGFVLFLLTNIFGTLYVHAGGAKHVYYIQPLSQLTTVLRWSSIAQPFGAAACAAAKTSVAGLTLRIAGPNIKYRRWFLYVGIFLLWALFIIDVVLKFAQCNPVRANWDVEIPPSEKSCWDPRISANVTIANSSFGTFMDFVLALLPCTIIYNLKMDMKTKLSLMLLLSLGVFAGIGSAIKTDQLHLLGSRTDFTWGVYDMYIWTEVELSLVIFLGCIPTIKPLFDWIAKGKPITSSGAAHSRASHGQGWFYSRSWRFSHGNSTGGSTQKSGKSMGSDDSQISVDDKSQLASVQEDERGIMVTRQWDVDARSNPSVESARNLDNQASVGAPVQQV